MGVNKNVVARVSHKEYKDSLLNNKYNIVNTRTFWDKKIIYED